MNYITEIKAFYDLLETNPLPSSAIAVWHALMHIANKTGWQQEFAVAVSVLEVKTGLNAKAIERARNRLAQDGIISWKSRRGNQSAIYTLHSLCDKMCYENVAQPVAQSVPQYVAQPVAQSVAINKTKQDKTKQISAKAPRTKFKKPTVEEIRLYCQERRNSVDAQRFFDYYESNGWHVGKNPMKDWKASIRTWERNGVAQPKQNPSAKTGESSLDMDKLHRMLHGVPE